MNRRQIILAIVFSLTFLLTISIFRPVPKCKGENCLSFSGTVHRIFEGGENDVIFQFMESDRLFYINRGLEQGLILEELQNRLMGKELTVYYPRYWTPLDPRGSIKHVSTVEFDGQVLFDERR
jgi:hypothetical protein